MNGKELMFVLEKASVRGGIERFVERQTATLRARGWKIVFGEPEDAAKAPLVVVHKLTDPAKLACLPADRTLFVVHDHDLFCPRTTAYTAWLRLCTDKPSFLRCIRCAPLCRHPVRALARIASQRARLEALRSFRAVITVSPFMKTRLTSNGVSPDRVHVIPIPVPYPETSFHPERGGRIVYVGQLIRGKGVDKLLRACALQEHPLPVDIIGDGNAREGLERLSARLGLSSRVTFHGSTTTPSSFLAEARLAAVPSFWHEPGGTVASEAAVAGVPVVAFDVGGLPAIVDHAGISVPAHDIAAYAAAMDRFAADPAFAAEIGAKGRAFVKDYCSPERIAQAWEAVFAEILGGAREI